MRNYKKYIFLLIIFLLYFGSSIYAKPRKNDSRLVHNTVDIRAGMAMYNNNSEFFEIYNNVFGSNYNFIKLTGIVGIDFKFQITNDYRLGVSLDFSQGFIQDFIVQEIVRHGITYYRESSEEFIFKNIPVLVNFEYNPYWLSQFKTFVGAGIGVNVLSSQWNENVNSNLYMDSRLTGLKYDGVDILPAFKLYAALDLGFDFKTLDNYLSSLILQVSYMGFLGKLDFYNKVRDEFVPATDVLNTKVRPFDGILSVELGINFNLKRKQN